jgi:hypothetical protein
MSPSGHHTILQEIVRDFDALGELIERALFTFAHDDSGSVDLSALQRAKEAAQRGANTMRDAMSGVRRAFGQ